MVCMPSIMHPSAMCRPPVHTTPVAVLSEPTDGPLSGSCLTISSGLLTNFREVLTFLLDGPALCPSCLCTSFSSTWQLMSLLFSGNIFRNSPLSTSSGLLPSGPLPWSFPQPAVPSQPCPQLPSFCVPGWP